MLLFLDDATRIELAVKDAKEAEKVTYDFASTAAAMALTWMAREHGFKSVLGGATESRSVGLEYLARHLSVRNDLRGRLLTQALVVDPSNDSARLALWHYRYRYETDLPALQTYWQLAEGVAEEDTSPVLKLGARYAQVAAGVNLRAALTALLDDIPDGQRREGAERELEDDDGMPTHEQVQAAASTMIAEIDRAKDSKQPGDLQDLAEEMEWSAKTLAWSAGHVTQDSPSPEQEEKAHRFTWGLTPHYNAACYWAERPGIPNMDGAIRSLVLAGETSDSEWLRKDPQLRKLRQREEFRNTFGARPRTDLLLLMPLATYAEGLRKQGLTSAHLLAGASRSALRAAGVPRGLLASIKHAGKFAAAMPEQLQPLQVEILETLDKAGYRFTIPPDDERAEVKRRVVGACQGFNVLLDERQLSTFLGGQE